MKQAPSVLKDVTVSQIKTNGNVRTVVNNTQDKELVNSVREKGIIEPVIIRKADNVLIAGHRRLDAARKAGLKNIPARIMDVTKEEALEIQVIENLQRKDLTPLEEAEAYAKLLENNGTQPIWDHKGKKSLPSNEFHKRVALLAKTVGKAKVYVLRVLRLVELPAIVKKWMKNGKLNAMHGALLVDLPELALNSVIANFLGDHINRLQPGDEFPVSDLRNHIETHVSRDLSTAIFPTDCSFAEEKACTSCPYNSGNAMALFGSGELGSCRQSKCFKKKTDQVFKNARATIQAKAPLKGLKKVRFAGYAGMVSDGTGRQRVPYRIKNQIVIPTASTITAKFAKILTENQELFKYAVVKPLEVKRNAKYTLAFVTSDILKVNKLLGLKMKAPKVEPKDNWYQDQFVERKVDNEINKLSELKLTTLKPSASYLHVVAILDYNDNESLWKQASKLIKIAIPKGDKKQHGLEKLSMAQLGLMFFSVRAIEYDVSEMLGIDRKAVEARIKPLALKEFKENEERKARENKNK